MFSWVDRTKHSKNQNVLALANPEIINHVNVVKNIHCIDNIKAKNADEY